MSVESGFARTAYRTVLLAAGLLVFGLLFHELVTLLLAILVTVIVAIALASVTDVLERRQVPRPIGALVALVVGMGLIVGIFALIIPSFVDQVNEFAADVPDRIDTLRDKVGDLTGAEPTEVADRVQDFTQRYVEEPGQLVGPLASIGLGLAGLLAALVLVLITAYYIAIDPDPLVQGIRRLVPPAYRPRADHIMWRLRTSWVGWMQGVAADMLISGVLLYVGLLLVGLDFAIVFAVFAALLVVIPYFGSIIGAIPPVLFALTDSPGKALVVAGIYLLVQQIESNVTIPLVMARAVKLHPAMIAVGVVVVGRLFGIAGLMVAVPILSLIVILVEELWVKPMEEADRLDAPGPMGVPPSSEVAEAESPRDEPASPPEESASRTEEPVSEAEEPESPPDEPGSKTEEPVSPPASTA